MSGDEVPPEHREALAIALAKLRGRGRFEGEIRHALESKGYEASADWVCEWLRERRIIDDPSLAKRLAESRTGKRAIGNERIRAELMKRGAPEETVERVLAAERTEDRTKDMLAVLSGRFRASDARAKGARFLLSRGFGAEEIEGALDQFFGAQEFPE